MRYDDCILEEGALLVATITVRNLEEGLKRRLRIRAAEHGKSMEEEVRDILRAALEQEEEPAPGKDIVSIIRAHVEPLGGIELELPPREPIREPPRFD